jgi:hypothetical protein
MFAVAGIYIDGSHTSAFDFEIAVIRFAVDRGYKIDSNQMDKDLEDYRNDWLSEETLYEVLYSLDCTYDGALDFLNSTAPDNLAWTVEDNSLFLEELV